MWTIRPPLLWLSGEFRQSSTKFKHQQAGVKGRMLGLKKLGRPINQNIALIGNATEVTIKIEEAECKALLDTGSTVSTINEAFYYDHLQHLALHPIKTILHIECADGNNLPYSGYIEGNITTQIEPSLEESYPCLLLVVPESNYNRDVPILLGTNILQHLLENVQEKFGSKCLQETQISVPWKLSF